MRRPTVPPEHEEWYRRQLAKLNRNPMVTVYGNYPGETCQNCVHLRAKQLARVYYKCDLRPNTSGPATDHRVNWLACGKFKKRRK